MLVGHRGPLGHDPEPCREAFGCGLSPPGARQHGGDSNCVDFIQFAIQAFIRLARGRTSSQLRILACAYACNPNHGSEEGVGWGWVKAIAQAHEIWALTDSRHRIDIERHTNAARDRCHNLRFVYVPRRRWHKFEAVWPPAYLASYRIWQRDAFFAAIALHRKLRFDLVHVITYVGFRVPGLFFRLGLPMVWGPVGGLENTPWSFLPYLGAQGAFYYAGRNVINSLHKSFLSLPKQAFEAADGGIVTATTSIQREVKRWYGRESTVIAEIGWSKVTEGNISRRPPNEPLRLCWSAQHLPGKALPLLFEALSRLPSRVRWTLTILGTGPCTSKWKRRARQLRMEKDCDWQGQLSREDAFKIVQVSHLFVTTSLKDLTSTVIVEAMAHGVPILCPDHCGFSDAVDETCGIKLPVRNLRKFIEALSHAITLLYDDEAVRLRLARGALVRVGKFSWKEKASLLTEIYGRKVAMQAKPAPRLMPDRAHA
jgi:glycosyltransferase involved in cell wall biosynthesis